MFVERILGIPVWMYEDKLEISRGLVRYTSVSFLMESLDEFDRRNIQLDSNAGMLLIESEDGKVLMRRFICSIFLVLGS